MPKRSAKKRRRTSQTEQAGPCDLYVVLPHTTTAEGPIPLVVDQLFTRLENIGYQTVALTHTIYGRPRATDDQAEKVLPSSLWDMRCPQSSKRRSLQAVRRLHAVIENTSDLSIYNVFLTMGDITSGDSSNAAALLLKDYDLVSVSPRNDATFAQTCSSAKAVDIITLDYFSTRGGLPFNIRPVDVQLATARGAVFEVPYAPAILHKAHRKAWIQACRALQVASLGIKVKVLVSSGSRLMDGRDVSAMALRSPEDLVNLAKTVMCFDGPVAAEVNKGTAYFAMNRIGNRSFGSSRVVDVYLDDGKDDKRSKRADQASLSQENESTKEGEEMTDAKPPASLENQQKQVDKSEAGEGSDKFEDGFIAF